MPANEQNGLSAPKLQKVASITRQLGVGGGEVAGKSKIRFNVNPEPIKLGDHKLQRRFFKRLHKNRSSIADAEEAAQCKDAMNPSMTYDYRTTMESGSQ